jgi:hypothetical protein
VAALRRPPHPARLSSNSGRAVARSTSGPRTSRPRRSNTSSNGGCAR